MARNLRPADALESQEDTGFDATGGPTGLMSRRRSLLALMGIVGAGVHLVADSAWGKKVAVPLSKLAKLGKVGSAAVAKFGGVEVLLIRIAPDRFVVLSGKCTHEACRVGFDAKRKVVACACHGSKFSLDGRALHGPARKPLRVYPSQVRGGRLIIALPE